jgi:VWFA-related protein
MKSRLKPALQYLAPAFCLFIFALTFYGQQTTPAQEAPKSTPPATPPTTLSVDVKVVTLPVSVRDKKGQIVTTLTKDDFVLQEDGRPQTIKYFNLDTNLPLTLGLLVDTSMSMRNALDQEKTSSKTFLSQMLTKPEDKAFLIHFDREVELLQDLTASKDKLSSALEELGPTQESFSQTSDSDPGSQQHAHRGGGTQLYDAIFLASDELMKKQQGRKALVVLSDGEDRGSRETINSAIEAAQRANTVIYTIYFQGEQSHDNNNGGGGGYGHPRIGMGGGGWPGGGGGGYPGGRGGQRPSQEPHVDGKKIMIQIAEQTGGRMFEAKKKENFDQIYSSIAEELRSQYMLGYTPDKSSADASYHKIVLTTKKKDLYVQTRDGYYADK